MSTARSKPAQFLLACLLALLACGEEPTPPLETAETAEADLRLGDARPRGLWVLCEGSQRVLEHPERIDELIEYASAIGATDLFVQVYRGGQAWFDSTYAAAAPYQRIRESIGVDTLQELVRRAHLLGIRVHAWVNVLSLANHRDAKIVSELGRDAVLVDRRGRSILDYPNLEIPEPDRSYYRMGTPAVWLDPAAPGVAEYLAATFAELMARYPEFDGLHLDYIRYPGVLPFAPGSRFGVGLDFGYGESTRARFQTETGLVAPMGDDLRNANRWDEWRREKMNELVSALRTAARSAQPEAPENRTAPALRSGRHLCGTRLSGRSAGLEALDRRRPARIRGPDGVHARRPHVSLHGRRFRIGPPIGSDLDRPRNLALREAPRGRARAARNGAVGGRRGEVLFSYDSIAEAPALRDALLAHFGESTGDR